VAREDEHDMSFIDMKLPGMNGLETYLAIREINPQAVTVMMASYPQEASSLLEESLGGGVYTCLYKPFDMEEVIQLVDEICRRKRRGGERDAGY